MDSKKKLLEMCMSSETARERIIQRFDSKKEELGSLLQKEINERAPDLNLGDFIEARNVLYSAGTLALATTAAGPIIYLAETGHETGAIIYTIIPGLSLAGCTFMSLWGTIKQVHHSLTRAKRQRKGQTKSIEACKAGISRLEEELRIVPQFNLASSEDDAFYLVGGVFVHKTPKDLRGYGIEVIPVDSTKDIPNLRSNNLVFVYGTKSVGNHQVKGEPWVLVSYPNSRIWLMRKEQGYEPDYLSPFYHEIGEFEISYRLPDEEVRELIKVAEGGVKRIERSQHWYYLGIPSNDEIDYKLEEQLNAIIRLGFSKNPQALSYMENLMKSEDTGYKHGGSDSYSDETHIVHPYAKGELASALSSYSSAPMDQCHYKHEPDERAIRIMNTALNQLIGVFQ